MVKRKTQARFTIGRQVKGRGSQEKLATSDCHGDSGSVLGRGLRRCQGEVPGHCRKGQRKKATTECKVVLTSTPAGNLEVVGLREPWGENGGRGKSLEEPTAKKGSGSLRGGAVHYSQGLGTKTTEDY